MTDAGFYVDVFRGHRFPYVVRNTLGDVVASFKTYEGAAGFIEGLKYAFGC